MRIKISFTKNTTPVPVNTQILLNSYVHNCLGRDNIYHDKKSDYSISSLQGGTLNIEEQTLSYENGSFIVISSLDAEFINKLLIGVITNPKFTHGMEFNGVDHINEVFINGWNHFVTLSPFLIKDYSKKKKYNFLTLKDINFKTKVKTYLINKLSAINSKLDLSDFDIDITENKNHRVRKIMVKNVINHANQCHISIHTNKKVAELLYNIGLGQSTGSGFGTIYKTENHKTYKIG